MKKITLLRMGFRQIKTVMFERMYMKTGIDHTAPYTIFGGITDRCNYKCRYCHYWQTEDSVDEMSISDWQRVLLNLREYIGRYTIQFVGGEPFAKKGFIDLASFCHQHRIDWGVITNGSALSSKTVDQLIAARPSNINVSVDSPDPELNDYIRGAPGSLVKIGKGIELLSSARKVSGHHFPIRIIATVTRMNYRSLPRLTEWAVTHGADVIDLHPVHSLPFWTPQMKDELWLQDHEVEEFQSVIARLVEQQKCGAPIETPAYKLLSYADQFRGRVTSSSIKGSCRVGMRSFCIGPSGDVNQCWGFPSIGNVKTQSAREIWNSPRAQVIRAETVSCPKINKECANGCWDNRSLTQEIRRAVLLLGRQDRTHSL